MRISSSKRFGSAQLAETSAGFATGAGSRISRATKTASVPTAETTLAIADDESGGLALEGVEAGSAQRAAPRLSAGFVLDQREALGEVALRGRPPGRSGRAGGAPPSRAGGAASSRARAGRASPPRRWPASGIWTAKLSTSESKPRSPSWLPISVCVRCVSRAVVQHLRELAGLARARRRRPAPPARRRGPIAAARRGARSRAPAAARRARPAGSPVRDGSGRPRQSCRPIPQRRPRGPPARAARRLRLRSRATRSPARAAAPLRPARAPPRARAAGQPPSGVPFRCRSPPARAARPDGWGRATGLAAARPRRRSAAACAAPPRFPRRPRRPSRPPRARR